MFVVARAGMSELAPENTIAAYLKCVEAGVSWFQADVRALADNALIMARDQDASRTTNGNGLFSDMEFGDLRRLDAGAWFGPQYRLERVPELTSVVELLDNTNLNANLELRMESADAEVRQTFIETVAQVLQPVKSVERLLVSSSQEDLVSRFAALNLGIPLALTVAVGETDHVYAKAIGLGCTAVILDEAVASEHEVQRAQSEGLSVWVSPVDDPARAKQLRDWGVSAVITDRAQELQSELTD